MRATSAAPVAMVFARSAIATFPPASRSPMMPEPTMAARRSAVPSASPTSFRATSLGGIGRGRTTGAGATGGLGLGFTHGFGVGLYHEDLPGVPVGIFDPDFVLQGVAAFAVVF